MASMWWAQNENVIETAKTNSELEDLFVFGYACKLFRDDEKAMYIDKGKHLIPWMGDDRLLIDRYDGRGHLYDLSAYDADNVKTDGTELSEKEQAVEVACDEERYLELRTDLAEAELYQEEEWKRYYESLHDGYKAVSFTYDHPLQADDEQSSLKQEDVEEVDDKPFVAPSELRVPVGVKAPETRKENAIIEKTAKFIAEHGTQMEIIIKTKQAGNPQFDFLHFENELCYYYKHMVKMIKAGKYKPTCMQRQESSDDDEHGYLHPSLSVKAPPSQPAKPIKMPAVAIHKTSYGQLIKSIKKSSERGAENNSPTPASGNQELAPLAPPPLPPFVTETMYSSSHPGIPPPPGTEPVVLPQPQVASFMEPNVQLEDTRGESTATTPIVPPPPDVQPIIDRMAMYVAKNGVEFEIVVKSKNDKRFQFLHSWHVHFPYYDFKKTLYLKEVEEERREKEEAAVAAANKSVSFSIKTKEPETSITQLRKPLFDYGSSDDEPEGESDSQKERSTDVASSSPTISECGQGSEVIAEVKQEVKPDVPVDEMEKKLAEERLKDRLANAAREKLAQATKEKQVQAERKRKAAMFINLLKTKPTSTDESSRDGVQEAQSSPRGTCSHSRSSTPGVVSCQERSAPRDDRESDRYDGYRRGWSVRSRSRSPRFGNRSRSRSPRYYRRSRSRSPGYPWRRRRSPTPPSAFSITKRSRSRSPGRLATGRRRSRSRSPRRIIPLSRPVRRSPSPRRSMSRDRKTRIKSPSRNKKRSRSKSPSSKHKKSKKSDARSPKKKKKDKEKEKSKDKKKDKKKERSKEKDKMSESKGSSVDNSSCVKSDTKPKPETKHSEHSAKSEGMSDSEDDQQKREENKVDGVDIEVIAIEDDEIAADSPVPPPQPPDLSPSPPPPPPDDDPDGTLSPHVLPDLDLSNSGRESPAGDAPQSKKEVSSHLLSRVREMLKASRKEIFQEEDLDDP